MPLLPTPRSSEFAAFAGRLHSPNLIGELAERSDLAAEQVRSQLATSVAEARQTLAVLEGIELRDGARVLEVGAGLGIASAFLASCGYEVTALEPGGVGFEARRSLGSHIAHVLDASVRWLTEPAETLDPSRDGRFDLALSNNVLEHVAAPATVLRRIATVMVDDGLSVHSCPNYSVPYEPHFGVPLVPGRPQWTARVLPRSIAGSGLWASLNFVRASDVVGACASFGHEAHFRPAALATSVERLSTDDEFRARHRMLGAIARAASKVGAVPLLRRLPATWSTPMDFLVAPAGTSPQVFRAWLDRGLPTPAARPTTRA